MPGRNGMGPMGQGARTGRGFGNCNGFGWGYRQGFSSQGYQFPYGMTEKESISRELEILAERQEALKKRLGELS